jgi:hypothetical protein
MDALIIALGLLCTAVALVALEAFLTGARRDNPELSRVQFEAPNGLAISLFPMYIRITYHSTK